MLFGTYRITVSDQGNGKRFPPPTFQLPLISAPSPFSVLPVSPPSSSNYEVKIPSDSAKEPPITGLDLQLLFPTLPPLLPLQLQAALVIPVWHPLLAYCQSCSMGTSDPDRPLTGLKGLAMDDWGLGSLRPDSCHLQHEALGTKANHLLPFVHRSLLLGLDEVLGTHLLSSLLYWWGRGIALPSSPNPTT